jgi:hypothetical protein
VSGAGFWGRTRTSCFPAAFNQDLGGKNGLNPVFRGLFLHLSGLFCAALDYLIAAKALGCKKPGPEWSASTIIDSVFSLSGGKY